jgi:hypothetical protein
MAVALSPTVSASPADDQFMYEVQNYVQRCPTLNGRGAYVKLPQAFGGLISTAQYACSYLSQGKIQPRQ